MAGQRIGYIMVSSLHQNTQRQLEGIQLERIFTDKASGKDTRRPQLEELLRFIRDGDTLVVHSMDRLARNLDDLGSPVQRHTTRVSVRIEFLKEQLAITLAKARGAYRGRRKALSPEKLEELRLRVGAGKQKTGLAREFGISRETLYSASGQRARAAALTASRYCKWRPELE